MGRPPTGTRRRRRNHWLGGVARLDDPTRRVEASFTSEPAMEAWIAEQLDRRGRGLEPEPPARADGVAASGADASVPPPGSFEAVARQWHEEWYVEMEHGGADRQVDVLRDMELHLFGPFAHLFELDHFEGRQLVKDWLRTMSGRPPKAPDSSLVAAAPGYAKDTVTQFLWMLRQVIEHARSQGLPIPTYAAGGAITAFDPVGRPNRKAPLIGVDDAVRIAAGLHVIHQQVMWLLRLGGLRISEAYGLDVEDLVLDGEGHGYLLVTDLGGRAFRQRSPDGGLVVTHKKAGGKTDAATRGVPLPHQLTELVRAIIAAFHTDEEGRIDVAARLVPTIRSARGGQGGFRSAFNAAAGSVFDTDAELEASVVAHDLRKGYATDLAWNESISGLLARRAIGHRAGQDVFSLVYTLDPRLKKHLAPVARALEADIDEVTTSLMVPTGSRPQYGPAVSRDTIVRIDSVLEAAGWQVDHDEDGFVSVAEAAMVLQLAETATRRLMGKAFPAVKGPRGWRARLEDVEAFRTRNAGKWLLPDLAADAGVPYHEAFLALGRLGIEPARDANNERTYVLTQEEADLVVGSLRETADLNARAVKIGEAAGVLGVAQSTVRQWIKGGRLEVDGSTDASGATFVTRASVEAERALRKPPPRGIAVTALCEASGLDLVSVDALVVAGVLVRERRGALTRESVRAWMTGYRPELLDRLNALAK